MDTIPVATDLGDLDGDGDLDWVTSSASLPGAPSQWALLINNGAGGFAHQEQFPAPLAAGCALMFDFDNDGDLDLALIDESENVVVLMKNSGTGPIPAVSAWGMVILALALMTATAIRIRGSRPIRSF